MSHNDDRLDALSHDHDDISWGGRELKRLIGTGHLATARARFGSYALTLLEHMRVEDHGLFAELEHHAEFAGSIRRLRADHDRLREAVTRAEVTLDDDAWGQLVTGIIADFAVHEVEEEEDLFPAAEVALPYPATRD